MKQFLTSLILIAYFKAAAGGGGATAGPEFWYPIMNSYSMIDSSSTGY
jgi:hypothetical protein